MLALALTLFGAHVAHGHFLASSHALILEKPEDKEAPEYPVNKTGKRYSAEDAKPDKNMAKSGEKYEPMFDHAVKGKEAEAVEVKPKYPIIFAMHTTLGKVFA